MLLQEGGLVVLSGQMTSAQFQYYRQLLNGLAIYDLFYISAQGIDYIGQQKEPGPASLILSAYLVT